MLPRNVDELQYDRLPEQLKVMVQQVGKRMKHLEHVIKTEKKEETKKGDQGGVQIMDKNQLRQLNQGAELTSSSDEEYGSE